MVSRVLVSWNQTRSGCGRLTVFGALRELSSGEAVGRRRLAEFFRANREMASNTADAAHPIAVALNRLLGGYSERSATIGSIRDAR